MIVENVNQIIYFHPSSTVASHYRIEPVSYYDLKGLPVPSPFDLISFLPVPHAWLCCFLSGPAIGHVLFCLFGTFATAIYSARRALSQVRLHLNSQGSVHCQLD
ncbi:hypothetical protein Cadr_000002170 [Camelus dromedarius]|uniref:Uncharacterized protein n=1 Tax=Camelus dromedarius TaxID=9838 RepID=A0A5N4EGT7_CAMDR|nr:hypothetical protein Cadr_000002170 [Camelus dromedarius]